MAEYNQVTGGSDASIGCEGHARARKGHYVSDKDILSLILLFRGSLGQAYTEGKTETALYLIV